MLVISSEETSNPSRTIGERGFSALSDNTFRVLECVIKSDGSTNAFSASRDYFKF